MAAIWGISKLDALRDLGEVALNGTVLSFPQYLEAAAAARRVSGVKDVHNHLEVVLRSAATADGRAQLTDLDARRDL